ncbi:AAA family ATPase [Fusarium albosuccineum]|uniref:AAA family ATPase n=1 Tax=Fusarium albosuccineum TaxID=1237068 RepID=A0A8H4L7N8_9HYPO|nr:AAA family ATPase [Fusarium albosuccineum]
MVDIATFNQMHHTSDTHSKRATYFWDDLEAEYMSQENPDLGDDFFMCLPTSISGFSMDKKNWVNLDVHFMKDVVWNTNAFEFLFIENQTKELIQAVVTNHVRTAENADLIQEKGNGLFILLHGGPGTGKTLTAERVACGDIGTKAEDIKSNLGAALDICNTWGCVVLLDEAEVFLEQRSLVNLERNEMVSTFLRMLEEYDGILILMTSNRVGTFDEAFMSRIQLNLRYKNLDRNQRLQIWSNFLLRLERIETERVAVDARDTETQGHRVNVKAIKGKINELADANLNGRQIRNTISMARLLARNEERAKLRATSWVFANVEVKGAALNEYEAKASPSKESKSNKLYRSYIGKQVIMTDNGASNNPRKVWHQGTLTMYKCRSCGKIYHQVYDPGFAANGNNSRGGFALPNMAHRITNTDGLCPACTDKEKEREKEKERAKEKDKDKDKNEDKEKPKPSP